MHAAFCGCQLATKFSQIAAETGAVFPDNIEDLWMDKLWQLRGTAAIAVPGALDVVRNLKIKKCVASNGVREAVLGALQSGGFMEYFTEDQIFTAGQVPRPKPYPDLFLYAAQQMQIPPDQCLVIEDGVPGVKAAVAAGMDVIGFTGTAHDPAYAYQALQQAGAQKIISHFAEGIIL